MRSELRPKKNGQAADAQECEDDRLRKCRRGCTEPRYAATNVVHDDATEHENRQQQCDTPNPTDNFKSDRAALRDECGNPQWRSEERRDEEPEQRGASPVALWLHC